MHLDAVEAGGQGVLCRVAEAGDDARQFVIGEGAGGDVGLLAFGGVHLVVADGQGAGGNGLGAVVEQRVAGPAAVPDLQEDAPAGLVHRVGHVLPAGHLGGRVDARLVPEGGVALHGHGGLGDEQAGTGALGVVGGHQVTGHVVVLGAAAGQGGHQDAVGQRQGADLEGLEQSGHG
jgi:hypothetical protein